MTTTDLPPAAKEPTVPMLTSQRAGQTSPPPASEQAVPKYRSQGVEPLLLIVSDQLDDVESQRIAAENRYRSLTTTWTVDGVVYGKGINPDIPEARAIAAHIEGLQSLEHQLVLQLQRTMRRHPLGPWVKKTVGVGEKQAARLIATIGDPASRERPSQLWAYCGLHVVPVDHISNDNQGCAVNGHGVAPKKEKGRNAAFNIEARKRVWLIAKSCVQNTRSPFRSVYDDGRVKYADAAHNVECKRCGPSGSPAPVGSPLSDGHKHARAIRLAMKEILLDMWKYSKGIDDG